ncbi:hypothetical protein HK100_007548, partial [Physocladia obscura]
HFFFATHSSHGELRNLVRLIKPNSVHPCVLDKRDVFGNADVITAFDDLLMQPASKGTVVAIKRGKSIAEMIIEDLEINKHAELIQTANLTESLETQPLNSDDELPVASILSESLESEKMNRILSQPDSEDGRLMKAQTEHVLTIGGISDVNGSLSLDSTIYVSKPKIVSKLNDKVAKEKVVKLPVVEKQIFGPDSIIVAETSLESEAAIAASLEFKPPSNLSVCKNLDTVISNSFPKSSLEFQRPCLVQQRNNSTDESLAASSVVVNSQESKIVSSSQNSNSQDELNSVSAANSNNSSSDEYEPRSPVLDDDNGNKSSILVSRFISQNLAMPISPAAQPQKENQLIAHPLKINIPRSNTETFIDLTVSEDEQEDVILVSDSPPRTKRGAPSTENSQSCKNKRVSEKTHVSIKPKRSSSVMNSKLNLNVDWVQTLSRRSSNIIAGDDEAKESRKISNEDVVLAQKHVESGGGYVFECTNPFKKMQ